MVVQHAQLLKLGLCCEHAVCALIELAAQFLGDSIEALDVTVGDVGSVTQAVHVLSVGAHAIGALQPSNFGLERGDLVGVAITVDNGLVLDVACSIGVLERVQGLIKAAVSRAVGRDDGHVV